MITWLNLFPQRNVKDARTGKQRETAPPGVDKSKYDSCVKKVTAKGNVDSPWAVCFSQLSQGKKEAIEPVQKISKKDLDSALKKKDPQNDKNQGGIVSNKWFWASSLDNVKPSKVKPVKPSQEDGSSVVTKSVDEQIQDLIVKNPGISGPTFLNLLKSKGLVVVEGKPETGTQDETKEADSSSSNTPSLSAGVGGKNPLKKTKKRKESVLSGKQFNFKTYRFLESDSTTNPNGTLFKTILLQEGLGNLSDRFFYTRHALESAIPVFEGKKAYANHPSSFDEQVRPERDVRDILGYFENVRVEESEDGRANLVADLMVMQEQSYEWARSLMRHSVDYAKKFPDKDLVGLSINANGDAQEISLDEFMKENTIPQSAIPKLQKAKDEGIESVRVVNIIESAVSCDLVTEAGAGGAILQLLEEEKTMSKKKTKESATDAALKAAKLREDEKKEDGKDGGDAGHDDAGKDKELIKSMLKKHLGLDDASEEEMEMYQGAMEAYKEMGMEDDKAQEAAVNSMKLAKHMQSKQAEAEGEEGEKDKPAPKDDADDGDEDDKKKESEDEKEAHKESTVLKQENVSLRAKLAKFEQAQIVTELNTHIENVCKESKLPNKATKAFKESLGKVKTKEEVDRLFKIFEGAYTAASGTQDDSGVFGIEKTVGESSDGTSADFSDCKF